VKHHEQHARLAFDEQRALEDLQRLHREIQRARGDRERAQSDFDQFVGGFRTGGAVVLPRREPAVVPAMGEPQAGPAPPAAVAAEASGPIESVPEAMPASETDAIVPVLPKGPVPDTRRAQLTRARRWVVPIAVAAMVVVSVLAVRSRRSTSPAEQLAAPDAVTSSASARPAAAAPAAPPEPQSAGARAASTSPLTVELVTRRPVWVRVFVDGRRAMERELPAGQRLPFQATRTVVVRAGDAGAISVMVNGRDAGPIGPDGTVATRAFSAESR
jgi:hypothetical protein